MRIACPSCAAIYEVPESRLKPGKMIRCARCGRDWTLESQPAGPLHPGPAHPGPAHPSPSHPGYAPSGTMPPPAEPKATPEPPPLPPVAAMDRLATIPAPPPPRAGLIGAWVASVIVLAAAIAGAFVWRDTIVRAWPPLGHILTVTRTAPSRAEPASPPPRPINPEPAADTSPSGAQTTGKKPE